MQKYGIKHSVLSAPFLTIAFLGALYILSLFPIAILLAPVALIGALSVVIFWIPINAHFARHIVRDSVAEDTGYLHTVSKLASVVGPLIGGSIIIYLGFPVLFAIGSALLLLSVAPLFLTKDYLLPLSREWENLSSKKNVKYALVFFMQGLFYITAAVLFPFYVYLQSESFAVTGIAASLLGVGVVISGIVVGKISDRLGKHSTMKISAIVLACAWLLALFSSGPQLYVLSLLIGVAVTALNIPIFAIFCEQLNPKNCEGFMIHREVWLNAGRAAVPMLMCVVLILSDFSFEFAFILSAIASIFFAMYKF